MPIDPTPFLATITTVAVALVAIIGGLLVARFVSLDSDQRVSRRVLTDGRARLETARERATETRRALLRSDAEDFFSAPEILDAVERGPVTAEALARMDDWPHDVAELEPFATEVAAEARRARETLAGRVTDPGVWWDDFRRLAPGLPEIRWPRVWERVYESVTAEVAEAQAAARKAAAARSRPFGLPDLADLYQSTAMVAKITPVSDHRATAARRRDELIASSERATQRAEDYEDELERLQQAHAEIVRPDARLWWGIAILIVLTVLGVVVPLWVMATGPRDMASVRWVLYSFLGGLVLLIGYIVVYLAQLTRRRNN
jgi:hypothetical protein